MSASAATDRALGVSFIPLDQPSDQGAVADEVVRFFEDSGLRPEEIVVWRRDGVSRRAYSAKAVRAVALDPSVREISIWPPEWRYGSELHCYLRTHDPAAPEFEVRYVTLTTDRLPLIMGEPVWRLLASIVALYPISHGCVGGYRSMAHASRECSLSGAVSAELLDPATRSRLEEDDLCTNIAKRKLRRLYPITIIGPDIWAQLPPMPDVSPAPTVEDLGNCKLLTAWPTLCEPRDPDFLRGTRALREWLWPYTIQNPADHVDNDPPLTDSPGARSSP